MSPTHEPPGLALALAVFAAADKTVPGYARHLADAGIRAETIRTAADFARVPPTTKTNFIRRYATDQLMPNGDITAGTMWSTSSGSSGRPTPWPRAATSLQESIGFYDRIFRTCFRSHERSTLVVVAFAMGPWIGGTYTLTALLQLPASGHRLSVITPGIDTASIQDALAALGPSYEQIVLVGYPPFVKDVLDHAAPTVLAQDIKILMAGEAITESFRDHLVDRLGAVRPDQTCLIYGTAEAGIMGHETPLTIAVRRAALSDPELAGDLFGAGIHGPDIQPTFVEYDPQCRYVETDDEGYLLFTIDTTIPLVRYRINDRGSVFAAPELAELLRRRGHDDLAGRVATRMGYIALHGRTDIAAVFYSLNIYPENLRAAVEDPAVEDEVTGKFVLTVRTDHDQNQSLHMAVELRDGVRADADLQSRLTKLALRALVTTNSEYRALHDMYGDRVLTVVDLHPFGTDGFAADIKHRWIKE